MGSTTGSANFDIQADGTAYVRLDPVTVRVLEMRLAQRLKIDALAR